MAFLFDAVIVSFMPLFCTICRCKTLCVSDVELYCKLNWLFSVLLDAETMVIKNARSSAGSCSFIPNVCFTFYQSMWAERSGRFCRSALNLIFLTSAHRSVPAPRPPAHAPLRPIFPRPAHRSDRLAVW